MSTLYSTILKRCQWKGSFPIAYQAVMGAIVPAKRPLSISSLQALIDWDFSSHLDVCSVVERSRIRTLLTGYTQLTTEIHILHLSFQDFLTNPDQSKEPYFIDPTKHSGILALKCLQLMNREFAKGVEGSGYLQTDAAHAELPKFDIRDDVWYACEFWLDHLADRQAEPCDDQALLDALRLFLVNNITTWLEISASKGQLRPVLRPCLRRYLQILCPENPEAALPGDFHITLYRLAKRISNLGRPEEGYQVSTEAMDLFRLIPTSPGRFDSALVLATLAHAAILVLIQRYEESLELGRRTIESLRALGDQDDPLFLVCLSRLLHNVAAGLAQLDGDENAKQAVAFAVDAVELQRKLPESADFELLKDLPLMVATMASCYRRIFEFRKATSAAEEAVAIYRALVHKDPAFAPQLARALSILSDCQGSLVAIQEAVTISEKFSLQYPSNKPSLAKYLVKWAKYLADLHRYGDAVITIKRAIALYREDSHPDNSLIDKPEIFENTIRLSRWLMLDNQAESALEIATDCVNMKREHIRSGLADVRTNNKQLCEALMACTAPFRRLRRYADAQAAFYEGRTLDPEWIPMTFGDAAVEEWNSDWDSDG
ncbi:hypothetical protein C8J56DRAFT_940758 [Mycena floridula]|nr:hypothetical protein C8J56DRAFT_940758 [Mycena floridula]